MAKTVLLFLIKFYRNYLSKLKLRTCRFYPTCSEYASQAVDKFGAAKGAVKTIKRILKCHPFHPGGYDPVEHKE